VPLTISTSGYITVYRDGVQISRHTVETKAVESAFSDSEANGDGTYELRFPNKTLTVSTLTKRVVPFYWQTVTLAYQNGTASSTNLATFLTNAQGRTITYTIKSGALPSGCTLSGSTISYDGAGIAAASSVQFTATSGVDVADSASVTCTIAAAPTVENRPPVWSVAENYALTQQTAGTGSSISVSQYASDPDGNALTFARVGGTAPAEVTVSGAGTITFPNSVAVGSYTVQVSVDDGQNSAENDWLLRSTGTGVVWAVDFSEGTNDYNKFLIPSTTRMTSPNTGDVTQDSVEGIRGPGALRMHCNAGSSIQSAWIRPFVAFPAGTGTYTGLGYSYARPWTTPVDRGYLNGLSTGNPGAGSTAWNLNGQYVDQGTTANNNWWLYRHGLHGHADYWADTRDGSGRGRADSSQWTWAQPPGKTAADFYIQMRCKISASFFNPAAFTPRRTKHFYIDLMGGSDQEVINVTPAESGLERRLHVYTYRSGVHLSEFKNSSLVETGGSATTSGTCTLTSGAGTCWEYPIDTWFTLLFHITPGHHNPGMSQYYPGTTYAAAVYKDTGVEVWAHREGETGYTKLFGMMDLAWFFNANSESMAYGGPWAFNCLSINGYVGSNNPVSSIAWDRWYDQIIFSHSMIPCPADGKG
jgi:hypothetical protein